MMTPLHHESHLTFRFTDDRMIPRFHLEGVEAGRHLFVFRLDPVTGRPADRIASATAGEGGWVDLAEPVVVRAGGGFVAVPGESNARSEGPDVVADCVLLRPVESGDLPRMYEMQLDPDSNRMAVTIPRSREAFGSHWPKALGDPANTTWAVLLDGAIVGYISCFPMGSEDHVGHQTQQESDKRVYAALRKGTDLTEFEAHPEVNLSQACFAAKVFKIHQSRLERRYARQPIRPKNGRRRGELSTPFGVTCGNPKPSIWVIADSARSSLLCSSELPPAFS